MIKHFFSIVIPAHNEEHYISKTLEYLKKIDYPKRSFEVIVIENGSTDKTYEVSSKFQSSLVKVYTSKEKGVSKARNFGAAKTSKKSEWIIFLDADTIIKENFLNELNDYLFKNKGYSVGTTKVMPSNRGPTARFWFSVYNLMHKITKSSFAIQMADKKLFLLVKYDESLTFTEDLKLINDLRKYGKFLFLNTDQVETSTRRFEKIGWIKLLFKWLHESLIMNEQSKREKEYEVIR